MSETDRYRTRTVTTALDGVAHDAAQAVALDPVRTDVVSARVTADGQLELTLEGPPGGGA